MSYPTKACALVSLMPFLSCRLTDVLIGRADVIVCHKGRTITRLDKAADACKPITRILKKDSILRAANTTMMPKSDFQRSLEVYEEAAR